jgi:hypothetical protein
MPTGPIPGSGVVDQSVPWFIVAVTIAFVLLQIYIQIRQLVAEKRNRDRVKRLEFEAQKQPQNVQPAWEVAQARLEDYFNRNLSHARWIFSIALVATIIGFVLLMTGAALAFLQPLKLPIVVSSVGVMSDFIGATFMAIYRAALRETTEFMPVLERTNRVGMAVRILDAIPDSMADLKNRKRAEVVDLLLTARKVPE